MSVETSVKNTVKMNSDGVPVRHITYPPNGTSHDLQKAITKLMHRIVMEDGRFTLAELGYLHINTLTYNKETGELNLRVYFDARYSVRISKHAVNSSQKATPVAELGVFKNYMFVGDLTDVVTTETIRAPKTKNSGDELNRSSLRFKDSAEFVETKVLVLNCNLALTMAAIHNISLKDHEFAVHCTTVGKGGKNAVKSIITTANMDEVPVGVTVISSANDSDGYDPDDAVMYLIQAAEEQREIRKNREHLAEKVRKDAKSKKKSSAQQSAGKGFHKYS